MATRFSEWCVLELLGHRRLAGHVSEVESFGAKLLRIDIPRPDGTFGTQFYGGQSIYSITPVAEDIARSVAAERQPEPVHRWELERLAPPPAAETIIERHPDDDDLDDDDMDDDDDLEEQYLPHGSYSPTLVENHRKLMERS